FGELNMLRADLRQAALRGGGWSYKANFGMVSSNSWSKSRTVSDTNSLGDFEYEGLRSAGIETRKIVDSTVGSFYGSARFDYNASDNSVTTVEGGLSQVQNELFVTGI